MVETVELSEYFSTLAHLVMMEHDDLHWIRSANISIGFVESDRPKKSNGRRSATRLFLCQGYVC